MHHNTLQFCEFCNRSGTLQRLPSGSVTDPTPYRDYPYPTEPIRAFFCTRDVCVCLCVCVFVRLCVCVIVGVIQHRYWPLRSTILNAHGTNASPDGLCTRTHTKEAFSCWFCCNSFRVDRARRGNVCLEDQAKACSPTDQPVRKFKDSLSINMTMKTFLTFRTE